MAAARGGYKYDKAMVERICGLIRKDSYSTKEICRKVKISHQTFLNWKARYPEFAEALQEAEDEFTETMLADCSRSLKKLVNGYKYTEKKQVEGPSGKVKEIVIQEKKVTPSLGAIIHYQTNKNPEQWKNRQSAELTGKGGKDLIPAARILTRQEAAELLKQLNDDL